MLVLKVLGLLFLSGATGAAPLASIHVKFVSPPHSYEHGITTDGSKTLAQKSFLSVGRRGPSIRSTGHYGANLQQAQFQQGVPSGRSIGGYISSQNAESLWPLGVFIPPVDINDLGYSSQDHITPDFSDGLQHPDPLLLNANEAMNTVRYLYGRELFYTNIPHVRALLRNQEERRANGLPENILSSLRPESPFYRSHK